MMKFVRAVRPTAAVLVVHRLAGWFRRMVPEGGGYLPDAGMNTAEYAIGTVAACAFAAVLYKVVTSETVSGALSGLLERSLHGV